MSRLTLDASVAVKLYIREPGISEVADEVRLADELIGPDLLWAESANVIWQYVRKEQMTEDSARDMLSSIMRMPIEIIPLANVIERALVLAIETDRSVYDCVYLATAVRADAVMLTADRRLVNGLAGHPSASYCKLLQH